MTKKFPSSDGDDSGGNTSPHGHVQNFIRIVEMVPKQVMLAYAITPKEKADVMALGNDRRRNGPQRRDDRNRHQ